MRYSLLNANMSALISPESHPTNEIILHCRQLNPGLPGLCKANETDQKEGTQVKPAHVGERRWRGSRAFNQELGGAFQTSVVRRGFDVEKATHERVDVQLVDGGGFSSLAEVGSPREEDGFHGLELVAVAVISFLVQLLGRVDVLSDRKELAL